MPSFRHQAISSLLGTEAVHAVDWIPAVPLS